MLVKEIEDSYEVSSIEKINIPIEVYREKTEKNDKSYQHLRDFLGVSNLEFFTITVLIGKFIVNDKKAVGNSKSFINYNDVKNKDEMTILKALAVNEVDNVYILKDFIAMRKIWQEYSYAGFEELYSWYSNKSIDFDVKFAEEIVNAFNRNKKEFFDSND